MMPSNGLADLREGSNRSHALTTHQRVNEQQNIAMVQLATAGQKLLPGNGPKDDCSVRQKCIPVCTLQSLCVCRVLALSPHATLCTTRCDLHCSERFVFDRTTTIATIGKKGNQPAGECTSQVENHFSIKKLFY